jgi:hypothetical protein
MVGGEPSVQVEVLHVEDRLSLDDRWSTEPSAPAQPAPAEAPKPSTRIAVAAPVRQAPVPESELPKYVDDSPIRPAGVPRWSLGKIMFVMALLGGVGAAAYVERRPILTCVAPYFEDVGITLPTSHAPH